MSVGQPGEAASTVSVPEFAILAAFSPAAAWEPAATRRTYLELEVHAAAVSELRHHIRSTLAGWGLRHVADDTELVGSEIVTNAIAASAALPLPARVRVQIAAHAGRLILMVWDASDLPPVRSEGDADAVTGRGLRIIDALTASWGYVPVTDGKIVWAVLDLDSR